MEKHHDEAFRHWCDREVFKQYGLDDLARRADERMKQSMNANTHVYTCLPTPPELEQFGLTHMVCRVDTPSQAVAAFNSSMAASKQCDSLNDFCRQDKPELAGPDMAEMELASANAAAAEREKFTQSAGVTKTENLTLQQKIELAQSAVK